MIDFNDSNPIFRKPKVYKDTTVRTTTHIKERGVTYEIEWRYIDNDTIELLHIACDHDQNKLDPSYLGESLRTLMNQLNITGIVSSIA